MFCPKSDAAADGVSYPTCQPLFQLTPTLGPHILAQDKRTILVGNSVTQVPRSLIILDPADRYLPEFHPYRSGSPMSSGVAYSNDTFNLSDGSASILNSIISLYGSSGSQSSAFSSPALDGAIYTPSISPDGIGHPNISTDPPALTRQQIVLQTCKAVDPDLRQLAKVISGDKFLTQPPGDILIAQFYSIAKVPGTAQPKSRKTKSRAKPRPSSLLEYRCLWCIDWIGYSKEKARNHLLVHLGIKRAVCLTWYVQSVPPNDQTLTRR